MIPVSGHDQIALEGNKGLNKQYAAAPLTCQEIISAEPEWTMLSSLSFSALVLGIILKSQRNGVGSDVFRALGPLLFLRNPHI